TGTGSSTVQAFKLPNLSPTIQTYNEAALSANANRTVVAGFGCTRTGNAPVYWNVNWSGTGSTAIPTGTSPVQLPYLPNTSGISANGSATFVSNHSEIANAFSVSGFTTATSPANTQVTEAAAWQITQGNTAPTPI